MSNKSKTKNSSSIVKKSGDHISSLQKTNTSVTDKEKDALVRQQSVIAELGQIALAEEDLDVLMEKTVRLVKETLDVEFVRILELSADKKELRLRAGVGWRKGLIGTAKVEIGLNSQAGYTLKTAVKEPLIVQDLTTEKRFKVPDLLIEHNIVSGISVIIGNSKEPFGELGAHTTKRRKFNSADSHFLLAVANIIAAAIERNSTIRNRKILFEISEKIRRAESPEKLLRQTSQIIRQNLKVSRCVFAEADYENECLIFHRQSDDDGKQAGFESIKLSDLSKKVITDLKAGLTVVNTDTKSDKRTASIYLSIHQPRNNRSMIIIPLFRDEQWVALLVVAHSEPRHWSGKEIELIEIVAERIWLAVEKLRNETALRRAHEDLEMRVEERTRELGEANKILNSENRRRRKVEKERGRLINQLVTKLEEERRRIARDLHDQLGQQLTALRLNIKSLRDSFGDENKLNNKISEADQIAKQMDSDISFLAWQLRPTVLDDLGLRDALINYVEEWSRHFGIKTKIHTGIFKNVQISHDVEMNLYRITQEILNNIVKHSQADHVSVVLKKNEEELLLIIEDNGIGFNPGKIVKRKKSLGLIGIRERAALIGGTVEIESSPGTGTTIFICVPKVFESRKIIK